MTACRCSYCVDYDEYRKNETQYSQILLDNLNKLLNNIGLKINMKSFKVVERNTNVGNIKLDGKRILGIYDGKEIIVCPYADDNGIHIRTLLHEALHSIFPYTYVGNYSLDYILKLAYEGAIDALTLFTLCKDQEGRKEFEYFIDRFENNSSEIIYVNIAKIWSSIRIDYILNTLRNFTEFKRNIIREFNKNKNIYECYLENCYYSTISILSKILKVNEEIITLRSKLLFC